MTPRKKLPRTPNVSGYPNQASQIPDPGMAEASKLDSGKQDSEEEETAMPVNSLPERAVQESSSQGSGILATGSQDLQFQEYEKLSMRLPTETINRLKQLKAEHGLPYEVIVGAMIDCWDDYSAQLQKQVLQQAQKQRNQRLMEGQVKAMRTLQQKMESNS